MTSIAQIGRAPDTQMDRLRAQAIELEGVFINTLVKEMFASLETENGFGGGFAEETWRGVQAEQFASAMAEAGGIGLAESLLPDLIALQESAQGVQPASNGVYK
jgi:peptidoglycan hydrolase FlgJ